MPDSFFECVLFLAGLAFGSFLNVCITRIPNDESVVQPRSHCRACGAPIRWFDNLPLLSYVLLRGRCRSCGARISLRYPAVELLTGLLFVACYAWYGPTWLTLKFCIFSFLLIGLIFMDAETGLLPHEFTYTGIVLGLAFAWIAPGDASGTRFLLPAFHQRIDNIHGLSLADSAIAAVFGAGFFYLAWALYYVTRKRHGLGFGDVALMSMAGAFLGLKLAIFVILCAPVVTLVFAIGMLAVDAVRARHSVPVAAGDPAGVDGERVHLPEESNVLPPMSEVDVAVSDEPPFLQREVPFGVFLGICSLAAVFVGEAAWSWYLGRF